MNKSKKLEEVLGVKFNNLKILTQAITHSSYANEHNCKSNERMEFLGDSVLSLCVSTTLFKNTTTNEGEMTKTRSRYVCEEALVLYASKINLASFLLLGHGEETTGGRSRPAIIADAFEAVLGAIYLDQGFDVCFNVCNKIVFNYLKDVEILDSKSILQELVQADNRKIKYILTNESGPSHNKTFTSIVMFDTGVILGQGIGKTKKDSEKAAAKKALEIMVK